MYISTADLIVKFVNSYAYERKENNTDEFRFFFYTWFFFNLSAIMCEFKLKATNVIEPDWSVKSQFEISPAPCAFVKVRLG